MNNVEYVRTLLLECPFIEADADNTTIDFIDNKAVQFGIFPEPTQPIIKRYRDGDTVRRFSFMLLAHDSALFDEDRAKNEANFERLSVWLEQKTRARALPDMGAHKTAQKIYTTGNPYMADQSEDGDSANYAIQIELIYILKNGG